MKSRIASIDNAWKAAVVRFQRISLVTMTLGVENTQSPTSPGFRHEIIVTGVANVSPLKLNGKRLLAELMGDSILGAIVRKCSELVRGQSSRSPSRTGPSRSGASNSPFRHTVWRISSSTSRNGSTTGTPKIFTVRPLRVIHRGPYGVPSVSCGEANPPIDRWKSVPVIEVGTTGPTGVPRLDSAAQRISHNTARRKGRFY